MCLHCIGASSRVPASVRAGIANDKEVRDCGVTEYVEQAGFLLCIRNIICSYLE